MAKCFYCGTDAKLTRAHLFQQDFRRAVPREQDDPGRVSMVAASATERGVYRDQTYPGDVRNVNVTSLCESCNSGWMNDIETAAAPAFTKIMNKPAFPEPASLFKLAHWAVVVAALSSETIPQLEIPVEHRRAIRYSRTGQARHFVTHLVFTLDFFPSFEFDLARFAVPGDETGSAEWCFMLHAGNLVIITASRALGPNVSRVLHENGFESVIGAMSSNIAYVPRVDVSRQEGQYRSPTHAAIDDIKAELLNIPAGYVQTATGARVADFPDGFVDGDDVDLNFDYTGLLIDMRAKLDLGYLAQSFNRADRG